MAIVLPIRTLGIQLQLRSYTVLQGITNVYNPEVDYATAPFVSATLL